MSKENHLPLEVTHHVRDTCLCMYLQRAARAVARTFDDALRPVGLTSGQFSILMSLNRPDKPKQGSVAELLAMDRTTLTANLKPLQRRGLLEVSTDPNDKRNRLLSLTDDGRDLLVKAYPIWTTTHDAVEAHMNDTEANILRQNLQALAC